VPSDYQWIRGIVMKGKIHILVAMFFMQFVMSSSGAIASPILPVIGSSLGVDSTMLLGMIVTLPTLTLIPTNLLSGFLAAKVSKKLLFFIGATFFLIGGLGPIFTTDIVVFLVLRAVMGIGIGFVFPLGFAMLPDYFEGDAQQTASGIFNAGGLLLAVPVAILAGIIGSAIWQNAFWMYAFGIVPVILVALLIPSVKPAKADASDPAAEKAPPPHVSTYITAIIALLFYIGITVATVNIAFFLGSTGLPTEQVTGLAGLGAALFSVGGFLASLLYGPVFVKMGKWTGPVFFALGALGFVLSFIMPTPAMGLVCMACCGISVGMTGPFMIMGAMGKSYWSVALTTSIILTGINLGQFLSPYAAGGFSALGGGSWPFVFLCAGIPILAIAVYYLLAALRPETD
jgi:MFS family permease